MKNLVTLYNTIILTKQQVLLKHCMLIVLLISLCLQAAPTQAQSVTWANYVSNAVHRTAVGTDIFGYSYVLSAFTESVRIQSRTIYSFGATDLLLIRYKPNGAVDWIRHIGSTAEDMVGDLAITISDENSFTTGTVYITGSFNKTIMFEDYTGVYASMLTSAGSADVFIARYETSTGRSIDAWRAGGKGADHGYGIALDTSGNVYLTGSFTGTFAYNKAGSATLSLISSGNSDVFVLKYNKSGNPLVGQKLGGTSHDLGTAIAVDQRNGDIYVTGGYSPPSNPFITNILVSKLNATGSIQWSRTFGSANYADQGKDIMVGPDGVYVTGFFSGYSVFNKTILTSSGSADAFLAMYPFDGNGMPAWVKKFGGSGWDEGQSLAYGLWNNKNEKTSAMYMGGVFSGNVSFGPTNLSALGGAADRDMFLARIQAGGTAEWAQQIGTIDKDYGHGGIALFTNNTIFYTGQYGWSHSLGGSWLPGTGGLLAKITLPTITGFDLVNAATDAILSAINYNVDARYNTLGTTKVSVRANTLAGTVGSIKFQMEYGLGTHKYTDNTVPFSAGGDIPTAAGGTDYASLPLLMQTHTYTVVATPYSGPDGTGVAGVPQKAHLSMNHEPAWKNLALVNAGTDADIMTMVAGTTIDYKALGTNQLNIRANTNSELYGSVSFTLDGVTKTDNSAPYTWAGDAPKSGGGTDYSAFTPSPGVHLLQVRVYSGPNATGNVSATLSTHFTVAAGTGRISFAEPDAEIKPFITASPNPFTTQTTLRFTAAEDGPVTVEIYNAQGVLVEQLYEGAVEAGKQYNWEFNAKALPAGMYIARVKAGYQVFTQKVMLVR